MRGEVDQRTGRGQERRHGASVARRGHPSGQRERALIARVGAMAVPCSTPRRRWRRCARTIARSARRGRSTRGRYVLGPEVAGLRARSSPPISACATWSASATAPTRSRIALRALGVEPGDEVVVPSFTFYASAEAVANAGATAGVLRRRPRHPQRHRRHRARGADAADDGDRRRRPVRPPAPLPDLRELGVPVLEDAAQAAGRAARRPHGRRAGRRRHVLLLPVQEPGRVRRRRARSPPTTTRSPSWRGRCASTAPGTSRPSTTWATTRASTRSRPPSCGCCCPDLDAWADGRRAGVARLRRRRAREHVGCRAVPAAATPAWHLYVVTHPGRRAASRPDGSAGIGARGYYRTPAPPPAGDGAVRRRLGRSR